MPQEQAACRSASLAVYRMCESWKGRQDTKGHILPAHPPVLPRKLSRRAHPLRIPAGQPVLCNPPPPSQGAQVSRQTTGSSPLQRLPGKLLISPGSSRIHLITVTGSQHGPPPPLTSPAWEDPPSSSSRLHSWLPAAPLSPH